MENDQMQPMHILARRLATVLATAAATLLLAVTAVHAQALQEGTQYQRLAKPIPVESGKKIEVLEFFSYGCPHCSDLDPYLEAWAKSLPADVEFRRIPIDFGREQWANLAKIYYTFEALGVESKMTPEAFAALHGGKGAPVQLWQEKAFFEWAAAKGLDRKKVEETYASFGVATKANRAKQIAKVYNVQSVPMLVVDGKFVTAPDKIGSHAATPAAINELIAKAKSERPKS
jgi:protein dithiol oxidoreductase (disulfide-forming)